MDKYYVASMVRDMLPQTVLDQYTVRESRGLCPLTPRANWNTERPSIPTVPDRCCSWYHFRDNAARD
ncbi:hypothetical protein J6590_016948 [Homalodisca vitripennis]|nr:hypothetical protein J6590_016948 [Homalodisca vitripennis]